jgi:hypothetical protein
MRLYLTATGRYVGTQDEARKEGKGWHLELVPDAKADLIDYLNGRLAAPAPAPAPAPQAVAPAPETKAAPVEQFDAPIASDGLPDHRVAFSTALVEAMFKPRPPALRELCYQVSKLNSAELAHVAFEVAHGFARRGL